MPVAWVILFYSFVLRARLTLGYWPSPYNPDPKALDFTIHHLVIWLGFILVPSAFLVAVGYSIHIRAKDAGYPFWKTMTVIAAALTVVLATTLTDPGRFFEWFID